MSIVFDCPRCKKLNNFCDDCISQRSVMKFLFNSEDEFLEHIRNLAKNVDIKYKEDGYLKKEYGPRNPYSGPYFKEREKIEECYGVFFGTQEEYDYFILGKDEHLTVEETQKIEDDNAKNTTPLSQSPIIIVDRDCFPESYPVIIVLYADKAHDRFGESEIFFQEYVYLSNFNIGENNNEKK